ncbi:unnamed protein product [Allacma fusca]|uniref:Uncharacterized protein n=1 Tax=Allacma fusca TaxID=39272 RepID=A0A8J2L6J9_9HEXA|nr:unnamed protein product [Allacma fusca]
MAGGGGVVVKISCDLPNGGLKHLSITFSGRSELLISTYLLLVGKGEGRTMLHPPTPSSGDWGLTKMGK